MLAIKVLIYLSIGAVAMLVPILIQSRWYRINLFKSFIITILLTICGTVGSYLMFFLENGYWGGLSFYGALFFVPIGFALVPLLLKIPYGELLDMCAPVGGVMLAIMKLQCFLSGCCGGRGLFVNSDGVVVRFPSQIVELITALIIFVILLIMSYRKTHKNCIYPIYMIMYGSARFVLNLFREVSAQSIFPIGNVWSLIAIAIGIIWLIVYNKKYKGEIC